MEKLSYDNIFECLTDDPDIAIMAKEYADWMIEECERCESAGVEFDHKSHLRALYDILA